MTYETNGLNGTGPIHFTNVRILDASGEYSYTGEVVVQGNRIKQITRGSSRLAPASGGHSDTVIDGMGATLMPGLIDAHLHLSWNNAPGIDPIQMMELEEHMLVTMETPGVLADECAAPLLKLPSGSWRLDPSMSAAVHRWPGAVPRVR